MYLNIYKSLYKPAGIISLFFHLLHVFISSTLVSSQTCLPIPRDAIYVGKGANFQYRTIQQALDELDNRHTPQTIVVTKGTYKEKIKIQPHNDLTIIGTTSNCNSYKENEVTIIQSASIESHPSKKLNESATVIVSTSHKFTMHSINIINSFQYRNAEERRAVALLAIGGFQKYHNCAFQSYQDTLYLKDSNILIAASLVSGAVDTIFGNARVYFDKIHIKILGKGWVTAHRRTGDMKGLFVFNMAHFDTSSLSAGEKFFLGRPWNPYAFVLFQHTYFPPHLEGMHWDTWNGNQNFQGTFGECQNNERGKFFLTKFYKTPIQIQDVISNNKEVQLK